ncbi:MAG: MFS transporter [Phaeodactylibacter sp.]|uniref:MFS transporter n=1 Tax=Phaeodactylibacter sp. TaxID=1940289 RepID=UPI0032ED5C53
MFQKAFSVYVDAFRGLSKEIWLLSSVMLINRAGAMVLPFLSVYLTQQVGFSLAQTGWIMSSFGAGSVLGAYLGGKMVDRIGFYETQFWSLFLSGFLFIALGQVEGFYPICGMVFLTSTVMDAFRPANFAAIAAYSQSTNRTRAVALLRLAINLGWAIGPAAGGMIAIAYGYEWLFWADGLTCIAAALFFRAALPKRFLETEEEEATESKIFNGKAYHDRPYLFFLLLALLNAIAFMQLFSTLPVYFKQEVLLDEGQIGRLMAMNGLVIALVEMPLIYLLEQRFRATQIITIGTFMIGLTYLLFSGLGEGAGVALSAMLMLTFGEMLSLPFIATMAMNFTNKRNRGAYMGLFTVTYSLSHVIAPNLGLQVVAWAGFGTLWYLLFTASVLAAAGFWLLRRREQLQTV